MSDLSKIDYGEELTRLHPAFSTAQRLLNLKEQDYGEPDNAKKEYFPFGDKSYVTMVHTKAKRLVNLVEQMDEREPNFEGIDDTIIDIINYAAFYYAFRKGL